MTTSPAERLSELWGPLRDRYSRDGPRRLLALDGGGIRGVLSLEILAEIERQLRELHSAGPEFRLCDVFDYIGGTSTGAIIAAGLARGMSVAELLDFYVSVGPQMFDRVAMWKRWKHLYDSDPLARKLQDVFGAETDLFPESLRCLLLVVTRNSTTDSPWPISSNPHAQFNAPELPYCNLRIPLWRLVRASTAAPVYFPPEVIRWDPDDPTKAFVFVDGGVTPYNNPAFLLFRMATLPEYRLSWPSGEDRLMLVSVGTGSAPLLGTTADAPETHALASGAGVLGALMNGAALEQDLGCRVVGRCIRGPVIDQEIGDLVPRDESGCAVPLERDLARAFLYARYQPDLTAAGLAALGLADLDPAKVQALDAVDRIEDLRRIGRAAAERDVRMADFGRLVEPEPALGRLAAGGRGGSAMPAARRHGAAVVSPALPEEFREELARAVEAGQAGDLALFSEELEGLEWEHQGLRAVGCAQLRLGALDDARLTLERALGTAAGDTVSAEDEAGRPARVLLFTGHRIDAPGRTAPRFPATAEELARGIIREAVEREIADAAGPAAGLAGGASGGDILFHEVCAELGIATSLYLAAPREAYLAASVSDSGRDWELRFDRLLARLPARVLGEALDLPGWLGGKRNYSVWQRTNLWLLHNALAFGPSRLTLIALWDGRPGDGPGGTEDLVETVRARGGRAVVLDAKALVG